MQVSLHLQNT